MPPPFEDTHVSSPLAAVPERRANASVDGLKEAEQEQQRGRLRSLKQRPGFAGPL